MLEQNPQDEALSGQTAVLRLSGEYDLARAAELNELFAAAYSAKRVILDFRDVGYIDSTTLSCLIRLKKRMAEHGPAIVYIVGPQANVRRILELTNLNEIFNVRETLDGVGM